MAVKTHALFYMRNDGEKANICVQIVHFFLWGAMSWCYLCSTFVQNRIVLTTMKRMLNRMLRYADAIVKRGVDKLIDAIGHSPEPQTKNAETPQPQKSMGNDTDCAPQTTGSTTNCDLAEQTISMTQTVCLRIVYAGIGGNLLPHTSTSFRGYKSKLFSLSKKSKSPIVRIPSSFRRGMMWSLTMIIFLKESFMLISDRDSCISFSLSGIDKADCT